MTTGSCSSRIACSSRFRLTPWGRTRRVGRTPAPSIRRTSPSSSGSGPRLGRRPTRSSSGSDVVGVDRGRALLDPDLVDRPGGLLSPGLLALPLAGVAGTRLGRRGDAPLERAAVGDVARDERRVGHQRARSAGASIARRRDREALTGQRPRGAVRCPGLGYPAARAGLPRGPSPGLTPAAARAGPIAGSIARAARAGAARPGVAIAATAIGPVAAPAGLHPPRRAAADEAGEALRAELLAGRRARPRLGAVDAFLVAPAQLGGHRVAAEHRVDRVGDVAVDHHPFAVLDLDDHVEGRRCLALEDALLGPSPARLLVAEGHALDPPDEVGQGRVEHQVVQVVAVGRADQLDAPLGDGPGGLGLELGPDLVDDDDLGHVVLDGLDHHLVLKRRRADLHPAGLADGRMGDVTVARDLVAGIDHDDPLAHVVGQDPGGLAQHRRLADARAAHDQDRLPALDEVVDNLDRAVDGPPDPAGQPDDLAVPVADGADPMQRPLDPGAIVVAERADVLDDIGDVGLVDLAIEEDHLAVREAGLRTAPEIEHDLDQVVLGRQPVDGRDDLRREGRQEQLEVVHGLAVGAFRGQRSLPMDGSISGWPGRAPARRREPRSPSSAA